MTCEVESVTGIDGGNPHHTPPTLEERGGGREGERERERGSGREGESERERERGREGGMEREITLGVGSRGPFHQAGFDDLRAYKINYLNAPKKE